ncbi:hypothetical protein PLESTB_001474500 [Pleodorina starrii]|uniref:Dof-type domain-containing protein n=1 Tax=Pleodorina starrii TaxID=330485 RepID=A0A9W6F888_9CHLO|nr:hypothetical protein PLESTM_000645900 [Pleodorina starrii]GLC59326.1 hypothetical protein PLESTB_001474500 [Pleodorina starrii]GLC74475.1 hypothetical protein PLESTF_001516800 [Pleodorina starrii]
MDGGLREAVSSSGQLEDWAAGVAADLDAERGEDNPTDLRRQAGDRDVTSPMAERNGDNQTSAAAKRSRQLQERDSSPDDAAKDGPRPKLPRPEKKETCPRCNSLDTKFCYYNNYNIKQPRFYCKTCQRYWTAGGTLRNIAPGSGRRKSKSKAVGREQRDSPSLADQLTAAAAVAQTSMFGLPVNAPSAYSSLNPALLAAADPTSILTNGQTAATTAAYAHQQLLGGHSGLAGLKLAGMSHQLHHGQWNGGSGLASDLSSSAALREHLQAHLGAAGCLGPASLAHAAAGGGGLQHQMSGLDARALLNGHGDDQLPAAVLAQQGDGGHQSSPPGSPPPQQQQQASSPQQQNSQLSPQNSPPQQPQHGSASDDPDAEGVELVMQGQGRRFRRKAEFDAGGRTAGFILGGGSLAALGGAGGGGSLAGAQLGGLNLPPSMASLAAVMGPGGGPSNLGGGLHPLLCSQDNGGPGGLLEGAQSGGLSRHNLQLALQQHQHQIAAQHESLQQLNGLLPHSSVHAINAHHNQLLHGLSHHHHQGSGNSSAAASSAAAAVAALDPLQRSALLQQHLGGVGWLQGGGNMLPSSLLLQQSSSLGTSGNSSAAADWISLAAAAAAKVHAPAAAHGGLDGGVGGGNGGIAAQMLQAQAAAFAAGGGCSGGVGWPSSGSFAGVAGGPSSWSSLWSSYNNPASSNYAGYALQAAAAAYSGNR